MLDVQHLDYILDELAYLREIGQNKLSLAENDAISSILKVACLKGLKSLSKDEVIFSMLIYKKYEHVIEQSYN